MHQPTNDFQKIHIHIYIYIFFVKIQNGPMPLPTSRPWVYNWLSLIAQQTKRRVCTTEVQHSWIFHICFKIYINIYINKKSCLTVNPQITQSSGWLWMQLHLAQQVVLSIHTSRPRESKSVQRGPFCDQDWTLGHLARGLQHVLEPPWQPHHRAYCGLFEASGVPNTHLQALLWSAWRLAKRLREHPTRHSTPRRKVCQALPYLPTPQGSVVGMHVLELLILWDFALVSFPCTYNAQHSKCPQICEIQYIYIYIRAILFLCLNMHWKNISFARLCLQTPECWKTSVK